MKKILLDTNAYSGFMSGNQIIFDCIAESEIIYMSTIMIGELFAGFHGGSKFSKNKKELKTFLTKEGVRIIDVSIETSEVFGVIKSELSQKGKMIPLNDIWIAAHAVETGAKLVTHDAHFRNISGLRLLDGL
jgi:tRNA(fMet)-specific endonuclease VapC